MDVQCSNYESIAKNLPHEDDKTANSASINNDSIVSKTEASNNKSEASKRKRLPENGNLDQISERETQRRSTRSRAYAQQVEEDIYRLRAELRSFLPTSLL